MKNRIICASALIALSASVAIEAQTRFDDPKETIKTHFWGNLYKDGGETLFCKRSFKKKSFLVQESYIYDTTWVRDYLLCGTPRQCREDNQAYGRIASDLHNIFPADTRFDLKRKSSKFEELGGEVDVSECGVRRSFNLIEPADEIKGDVARAILYMHYTYNLPLVGYLDQLKRWHNIDPPSPEEVTRNQKIKDIQGNDNVFVVSPEKVNDLL